MNLTAVLFEILFLGAFNAGVPVQPVIVRWPNKVVSGVMTVIVRIPRY